MSGYNEAEEARGAFPWPDGEENEQDELRRIHWTERRDRESAAAQRRQACAFCRFWSPASLSSRFGSCTNSHAAAQGGRTHESAGCHAPNARSGPRWVGRPPANEERS